MCSPVPSRPTRSTARRSRCSSPTTCWPATVPAPSWRYPGRTSGTGSSPRSSTCRSSVPSSRPRTSTGKAYTGEGPAIAVRIPGRTVHCGRQADRHRVAGEQRPRYRRHHVPAARLAVQPPAVLGRAVPDRLRRDRAADRGTRRDAAGRAARGGRLLAEARSTPTTPTTEPETPLSRARDWVEVELDLGDGPKRYTRETNVMPQWAGSCWYELRYLDPTNAQSFVDPENERYWMGPRDGADSGGVDLYVGGAEHAVLHLLYARFWHKVLYDLGHVSSLRAVPPAVQPGLHPGLRVHRRARPLRRGRAGRGARRAATSWSGRPVTREYGKMGKSLRNVVTPDEMCDRYGADTFRVYEMSMGPLEVSRPWETRAVIGAQRFLQRVWRAVVDEQTGESRVGRRAGRRARPAGCCTGSSTGSAPTWTGCGSTPPSPS